jgi:hypothetical protein
MLRVLFGALEETNPQDNEKGVPPGFDVSKFETLRWHYHEPLAEMSSTNNPKVVLDLAAIPEKFMRELAFSIHRPVPEICRPNTDLSIQKFKNLPLATHHYLGSWERYSARADSRRTREVYDLKSKELRIKDDYINSFWLAGFARELGLKTATELLGSDNTFQLANKASAINHQPTNTSSIMNDQQAATQT